jgi:glycerol-3-phosphate acyltransferase PlsY
MILAAYFVGAFFLGAVPNGYLAGRLLKGIDIRQQGSGNVGATNVFRVLGKGPGLTVFALDFLKGALPVFLFTRFFSVTDYPPLTAFAAGFCAVLGHMFTPFLGFKGGKGVATSAGALCAAFPLNFLAALCAWMVVFSVSRIVSVSSLSAVLVLLFSVLWSPQAAQTSAVFLGLVLVAFWTHRANIRRLIKGEEYRFGKETK